MIDHPPPVRDGGFLFDLMLTEHQRIRANPPSVIKSAEALSVELGGVRGIEVDKIKSRVSLGATTLEPAHKIRLHDLDVAGPGTPAGCELKVAAADCCSLCLFLDGDDAGCPPLQRFASHHAAAAAEIQPVGFGQTGAENIHHGFPHPGCCGTGGASPRTEEFATTGES